MTQKEKRDEIRSNIRRLVSFAVLEQVFSIIPYGPTIFAHSISAEMNLGQVWCVGLLHLKNLIFDSVGLTENTQEGSQVVFVPWAGTQMSLRIISKGHEDTTAPPLWKRSKNSNSMQVDEQLLYVPIET